MFRMALRPGFVILAFLIITACNRSTETTAASTESAKPAATESAAPAQDQIAQHIATFDDLDFNVFSNQKWGELSRSHSKDILVHWPDGHTTTGIERHIEDLKAMFVYAPDTRIKVHPVKFGSSEWTCVIGEMEGTFTKPMPIAGGKPIPPTGKAFKLPMCTVGRWANGVMVEEFLFWDNQSYMKQIGLGSGAEAER
jgi:SnoaL-like polyketide cyclase